MFFNDNLGNINISYNIQNIINITSDNNNLLYVLYKNNDNFIINSYSIENNILKKISQSDLWNISSLLGNNIYDIYYFNNTIIFIKEEYFTFKKSISYNNDNDLLFINDNNDNNKFYYCYNDQNNFFISILSNIMNYDMKLSIDEYIGETINEIFDFDIYILHYFINNNNINYNKLKINYKDLNFIINTNYNNNYQYDFDNGNKYFNYNIINFNNNFYLLNNNFNVINLNQLNYQEKYKLINYKVINEDNQIKFIEIIQTNNYIIKNNINPILENLSGIVNYNNRILYCYNKQNFNNDNNVKIYKINNNQLEYVEDLKNTLDNPKIISSLNKLTKNKFINNNASFNNSINLLILGYITENNNSYNNILQLYNNFQVIIHNENNIDINYYNLNINNKYMINIVIQYGTLYYALNETTESTNIINNIYILFNDLTIKQYIYNYKTNDFFYYRDLDILLEHGSNILYNYFDGLYINNNLYILTYNNNNDYNLMLYYPDNILKSLIYKLKDYLYIFIYNNVLYLLDTDFKLNKYDIYNNSTLLYNISYIILPNNNDIYELNNIEEIIDIKTNITKNSIFGYYFINKTLNLLIYENKNNLNIQLQLIYNNII